MDFESYDLLILKTKESLDTKVNRSSFITCHFSSVLQECNNCVTLSLDLVVKLLQGTNIQVNTLRGYLEDAISLLQMLSDFIKNVIESTAMACCSMKPFPVTTGNIILTVFVHCKDSECIYGDQLRSVETQLKDLFRTCHELQLTYLMTMEKHFIFDLTEKEEQEILIEALNINMKIGEIVQALDVKTMAEQWKAYTVICEKYSNFLLDRNVYNNCAQLLASIVEDNIKTATQPEQDNKAILRSLKVANFTIKILLRISNVFKHATSNSYEAVVELLQYIYIHNPSYLEVVVGKSQQFTNLVQTNILNPTDSLCTILLQDEKFMDYVSKSDVRKLDPDKFLGHIILITSAMKSIIQSKEDHALNLAKQKVIDCVYRILPMGHYWFNIGLKFHARDCNSEKYFGLYEHLLLHMVAFTCTLNSELYATLEKYMYEAILSTDCYSAIFSSNLWIVLVRIINEQLAANTVSSLIEVYQKLGKHRLFQNSPQEVHLRYVIGNMFKTLSSENKRLMSKQFSPENNVWCALKICHLPDHLRKNTEAVVIENLKSNFDECFESGNTNERDVLYLIQTMKIASTICSRTENINVIEEYLIKLWSKACHKNQYIKAEDFITSQTVWNYNYLEALAALTESVRHQFSSTYYKGKVLHIISTNMDSCNTEMIVLLFNLFCTLTFDHREDENQYVIVSMFKNTLKVLLRGIEALLRSFILKVLSKYKDYEHFHDLTYTLFYEDESLNNEWILYCDNKFKSNSEWKQQLTTAGCSIFTHKCIKNTDIYIEPDETMKVVQPNFDLGDFLFDLDSEEPSRKKAKLDLNETDSLLVRLENDTALLCKIDTTLSDDSKTRISNVINKLKNILS